MATPYAFVTVLTSDSYLPGALTLAGALRDLHPSPASPPEVDFQTVCLVTPHTVDVSTIKLLRRAFDLVVGVEPIRSGSEKELKLLGRPDLAFTPTKLHIFRLTQYSKIIFLDADVLPILPLSHLFTLPHEFSAVPDVGWPDIFNSGVVVLSPGEEKFSELHQLLKSKGSWDGGDQGLLNEWRGGDWNRLSFTYNTTPTAAYTYAPAYERYGSQISAIHFIGANKPWHSIPSREPGVKTSQSDIKGTNERRVYDYDSLVDKWFDVYDRHYRSPSAVSESQFGSMRYISAWDGRAETVPGDGDYVQARGGLGLEDLRKIAVEGMSSATLAGTTSGEGTYISLPLENRLDLMPARAEEDKDSTSEGSREPTPAQDGDQIIPPFPDSSSSQAGLHLPPPKSAPVPSTGSVGAEGLSTPLPEEIPPSPQLMPLPLPPSMTPTPIPKSYQTRPDLGTPLGYFPADTPPGPIGQPRPPSPPLVSWNPAIEPPPTTVPTQSVFQPDTFFRNVWDQPHTEWAETSLSVPEALFQVPPLTDIPESLLRQGHYRNVTGGSQESTSPSPDRTKIKKIFPWEGRPRHWPARVFPGTDTPPPGMFISPQSSPGDGSPSKRGSQQVPAPSPLSGMPPALSFLSTWCTVPGMQRQASKFSRSPVLHSPLGPGFERRRRRPSKDSKESPGWQETAEASSRDADDEDDGEESAGEDVLDWMDDTGETSPAFVLTKGRKEYQNRGVQTLPFEAPSENALDSPFASKTERELESSTPQKKDVVLDGSTADDTFIGGYSIISMPPLGSEAGTGAISPREFSYSVEQSPAASVEELIHRTETLTAKDVADRPDRTSRRPSDELEPSWIISPPSSIGPTSPQDARSLPWTQPRKVGRVWDPAKRVDIVKRESEEVWAKFIKGA